MSIDDGVCPACGRPSLRFFRKLGEYRCTHEDCGEGFRAEPVLDRPEASAPTLDLETLPFPVAYPLAHARDARLSARDRAANAIFAAYQAMRTTALLLLAEYLACDTVCRQLQRPIRGLRLPHWNEWSLLCDRLCKYWAGDLQERPERETHFRCLVDGWREVNRQDRLPKCHPWAELLAGMPGLQGKMARNPNDAIWKAAMIARTARRRVRSKRTPSATHCPACSLSLKPWRGVSSRPGSSPSGAASPTRPAAGAAPSGCTDRTPTCGSPWTTDPTPPP